MAKQYKAVVVGGLGIIGRSIMEAMEKDGSWDIVALSRRKPWFKTSAKFISVDLLNPKDAKAKLKGLTDTTHIFYCALSGGVEAENTEGNLALVANSIGVIAPIAKNLKRVILTQGGKYYGCHLGPHRTPSKESDPRHLPPNFYYNQQDFIAEAQKGKKWDYICVRPEAVVGYAVGIPLNTASIVAHYATFCREMGVPLHFPGPEQAFKIYNKFTDARILGRFQVWVANHEKASNEAFNITNESGFRWCNIWPWFTDYFKVKPGVVMPFNMVTMMGGQGPEWAKIVKKYKLQHNEFDQISWGFGNWNFGRTWDTILEDTKRFQHGFYEVIDMQKSFKDAFDKMRKEKVVP